MTAVYPIHDVRRAIALAAIATLAPACTPASPAAAPLLDARGEPPASPRPAPSPEPTTRQQANVVLEHLAGAEAARASAAFAPVRRQVGACGGGLAGVVRVRLEAKGGRASYTVEPGTLVDPAQRRCVLEALSIVDVDGIHGTGSPSARPSGFTALIRLEW
jgi:hypothetical protein